MLFYSTDNNFTPIAAPVLLHTRHDGAAVVLEPALPLVIFGVYPVYLVI